MYSRCAVENVRDVVDELRIQIGKANRWSCRSPRCWCPYSKSLISYTIATNQLLDKNLSQDTILTTPLIPFRQLNSTSIIDNGVVGILLSSLRGTYLRKSLRAQSTSRTHSLSQCRNLVPKKESHE
jgi:hypothetical protein